MLPTIILGVFAATAHAAIGTSRHGVGYFWSAPTVEARMDPIISPGQVSQHVHTVMGGDGFKALMGPNDALNANCTGSNVVGDNSNYWFPKLYFQDPATKQFEGVDLLTLHAYYKFDHTDDDVKPFPPGFQMVSGKAFARSNYYKTPFTQNSVLNDGSEIQPISWYCNTGSGDNRLAYQPPNVALAQGSTEGTGFPLIKCGFFLGSYVHFPSCIDESKPFSDYSDNTAWPNQQGNCPAGYTHVPHIFLEIQWNTAAFSGRWTENGKTQPFVLANGDTTGYAAHADFFAGWDQTILQHLIDTCGTSDEGVVNPGNGLDSCPGVANYDAAGSHPATCSATPFLAEDVKGPFAKLPGCNPTTQLGPQDAVICDCSSGSPVCNGKSAVEVPDSTSSTTSSIATSSNASSATGVSSTTQVSLATQGSSTLATQTSSSKSVNTSLANKQPVQSSATPSVSASTSSQSTPSDGEYDDETEDEDDNSCEVAHTSTVTLQPTVTVTTMGTPSPNVRRHLGEHGYRRFHGRS